MRGFSKPRIRCYDLESVRDSALGSELTKEKWKEERERGERRVGEEEAPQSVRHRCASAREHLLVGKRTLQAAQAGRAAISMSRPWWEQRAAWTGLACPPLQTCSSLGPSQRPLNPALGPFTAPTCLCSRWPSLPRGAWDGTLTVGATDARPSTSQRAPLA